jgi:hypothetical protein
MRLADLFDVSVQVLHVFLQHFVREHVLMVPLVPRHGSKGEIFALVFNVTIWVDFVRQANA